MTKLRESKGGAYERRGAIFLRVTVAPQTRRSERLTWVTADDWAAHDLEADACVCVACLRAREVQGLVNRYRAAGAEAKMIEGLVTTAAKADAETLDAIRRSVDGFVEGRIPKASPPKVIARHDTIGGVIDRWTSGELHRLYPDHVRKKNADSDAYRAPILCSLPLPPELRAAGARTIGDLPVSAFTVEHAELLMREIDAHRQRVENERAEHAKRKARTIAPLDRGGRRQYAQQIRRTLEMSVYPLKLIKTNPIPRGWLPRVLPKAKSIPYPDEERAVLEDHSHPIHWRIYFGTVARIGYRADEAASLTIADVDVERGIITLDENKTDDPRAPSFGPNLPGREWYGPSLMRALKWKETYRKGAKPNEPFFIQPSGERIQVTGRLAERWRAMLEASTTKAGIHRPELFKKTAKRLRTRAHDLRGMFVTYALANGMTETWVADRTGHKSSAMINRYRQTARTVHEAGLGDMAPLDQAIPEVAAAFTAANAAARRCGTAVPDAAPIATAAELSMVAPLGLEPRCPSGPEILNLLRIPFRQGAASRHHNHFYGVSRRSGDGNAQFEGRQ